MPPRPLEAKLDFLGYIENCRNCWQEVYVAKKAGNADLPAATRLDPGRGAEVRGGEGHLLIS